jgi:soluble lytic murein transglycosylase
MQLMPDTADYIAQKSGGTRFVQGDLADPQVNIAYGSWYLRYLLDKYEGREVPALAAYNAGQGNVDEWIAGAQGDHLTPTDIPFAETRHYVAKVLDARDDYRREYKHELGL